MAMACLGNSIDVLVGGADLAFPHHAYQAAMVEAATGVAPFARAVVHVGEVRLAGEKMAKSTGNLVLVGDVLQSHSAPAVRLALLNRVWDQPWECADAEFETGRRAARAPARRAGRLRRRRLGTRRGAPVAGHGPRRPGRRRAGPSEGGGAARFLIDVLKLREAPLP